MKREIRPPFVPQLSSPTDVDYFSREFTGMDPKDEMRSGSMSSNALSEWTNFSYAPN
jgi:hypothetical protein